MRLILDRDVVHRSLLTIRDVANRKSTIEGTAMFRMAAVGGVLTVHATNLESFASVRIPVQVLEPGEVALPAHAFCDLLKIQPSNEVQLVVNDRFRAALSVKSSKYRLAGCDPKMFPKVVEPGELPFFDVSSEVLRDLLDHTLFAVNPNETRYRLSGVCFEAMDRCVRAVGCDGLRLVLYQRQTNCPDYMATLPRPGLERLITLLRGNEVVAIAYGKGWVFFRVVAPDATLAIRCVDEPYIQYEEFFPKGDHSFIYRYENADELRSALGRLKTVGNELSVVRLDPVKNGVRLSLEESITNGAGEEVVDAVLDGDLDPVPAGIRLNHLLDCIPREAKTVALHFESPRSPVLLRVDEPHDYMAVVVPSEI